MSKRKTVSLCMLAYNNETIIGLAIKSALALVDEVIVVDLGSRDNTRIIAEGYGARILERTLDNDYAKARNSALDEAACDWVLVLNPNEIISPVRPAEFQRLLETDVGAYNIDIVTQQSNQPVQVVENLRLFRLARHVRYQYPARERIEYSFRRWQHKTGLADIKDTNVFRIMQDTSETIGIAGYGTHVIHLLRKATLDEPAEPYFEYAIACEAIVEVEGEVLPTSGASINLADLERAWKKFFALDAQERQYLDYLPDLMVKLAACYLATGQVELAWQTIAKALEDYPENDFVQLQYLAVGIAYLQEVIKDHNDSDAHSWERQLLAVIRILERSHTNGKYIARYSGELALFRGDVDKAWQHFKRAMNMDSSYSYAWLGLAQCQMYLGCTDKAIQLYMEATRVNEDNYRAWLQGSNLLEKIGFANNAAAWRSMLAKKFPRLAESGVSS